MSAADQNSISSADAVAAFLASVSGHNGNLDAFPRANAAEERRKKIMNGGGDVAAAIGLPFPEQGIFLGRYTPQNSQTGETLNQVFNVFAAPENLSHGDKITFTYNEAVQRLASLEKWHGHNGADFEDNLVLFMMLKTGRYKGEWIIPPRELLDGKDSSSRKVQADNIFAHQEKGAFNSAFPTATGVSTILDFAGWYWSSTSVLSNNIWRVYMRNGERLVSARDNAAISCRPVRLVEVMP